MIELKAHLKHPSNRYLWYDLKYAKKEPKKTLKNGTIDDYVIGYIAIIQNEGEIRSVGFESESYLTDFNPDIQKEILRLIEASKRH